ncbi:MAG: histidinol dehydrogenase [Verrucomicrobiota bacterium]|nr:histidinol dehydrogenase [Verrucomicrobiota bacterium]
MRILRHSDPDFPQVVRSLQRKAIPDPHVEKTVREIIRAVREEGDLAVLELTARFGGPRLEASELRVNDDDEPAVDAATREAIATAHHNVLEFANQSLRKSWSIRNAQGAEAGERFDPFQRVGIYVPGGTAPLVSTAIMTVTLAAAAGVPQIVVTTPPDSSGKVNGALLHALRYAGATEIHRAGGAQAIAALAYGTGTIQPVQKVFGPGNAYVVEAKRQVFGQVAIDLLPGPSEILVLADAGANAAWVAADLLAQAEHGKGSAILLVTSSGALLEAVSLKLEPQLAALSRQEHLAGVLENGCTFVLVESLADAVALTNEFAPEHVSVVTENEEAVAAQITTAGAIFLGGYSPVAAGDFLAGPSHTLPTGGAGKSFPGLTADMFQRRTSIIHYDAESLRRSVKTIEVFSALEGLDAHARSARIRFE